MRKFSAAILFLAVAASACLGPMAAPPATVTSPSPGPSLAFGGQRFGLADLAHWNGNDLEGDPTTLVPGSAPRSGCAAPYCETILFHLEASEAAQDDLVLRVMTSWSYVTKDGEVDPKHPAFSIRLLRPDGLVAPSAEASYGALARIEDPPEGRYELSVRLARFAPGLHSYDGSLRIDAKPATPPVVEDLLPDLALAYIGGLRFEKSATGEHNPMSGPAPWTKGCAVDEAEGKGVMRCLRFAAAIANAGPGPLMLYFPADDRPVDVEQCILRTDGSTYIRMAGTGSWHDAHGHYHQADVVEFGLYKYDLDARARGQAAVQGQKFGWGFYPQGVIPHLLPDTFANSKVGQPLREDCPALGRRMDLGLPQGWHDPYLSWRNGNFVDVTHVPDGIYELAIRLNVKNETLERGTSSNDGSILLRLRGDEVDQLTTFQPDFAPRSS